MLSVVRYEFSSSVGVKDGYGKLEEMGWGRHRCLAP
jgi:hypothetical protein